MTLSSCKFSLLVAVYNAEKYISACLDSLIGQTLHDIQIICIDDASTDCSLNILQNYALRDNRIEVIHLNNNMACQSRKLCFTILSRQRASVCLT